MTTYLQGGWFERAGSQSLRSEVIDGAMDVAGTLLRGGGTPAQVNQIAFKVRSLIRFTDSQLSPAPPLTEQQREGYRSQLETFTDENPVLQSFLADCLEHVHTRTDLFALYLHLVHVTRMMQLLSVAVTEPTTPASAPKADAARNNGGGARKPKAPSKRGAKRASKKSASKKVAAKKRAGKKSALKKGAAKKKASKAKAGKRKVAKKTPRKKVAAKKTGKKKRR